LQPLVRIIDIAARQSASVAASEEVLGIWHKMKRRAACLEASLAACRAAFQGEFPAEFLEVSREAFQMVSKVAFLEEFPAEFPEVYRGAFRPVFLEAYLEARPLFTVKGCCA